MSYAMRLQPAPNRRNEGEPSIGIAQAEQLAQQLAQASAALSGKAGSYVVTAQNINERLRRHAEEAAAQIQTLLDTLRPENEAYAQLYEQVESAYFEWDEPSDGFYEAYQNAVSDFDGEVSDLEDLLNGLLS